MTKKLEVYRCNVCGNIVEVQHSGQGNLVCCGQTMELMEEKREEEGNEKHLPVIEEDGDSVDIVVGEVEHPMEESHYIEWIEIITSGQKGALKKFLNPGDEPRASFNIDKEDIVAVREYCSVHGLWKMTT